MMGAASINGITIGYDDAGAGQNVLVLVHGHPFDRSMWRPQVEKISRQDPPASARAEAMRAGPKTPRLQRVIGVHYRSLTTGYRLHDPSGG